jgi:hypothetical protein
MELEPKEKKLILEKKVKENKRNVRFIEIKNSNME